VATAFADRNRLILSDTRQVYGEDRFQLMGRIEERLFVVAFTPRDGATRIISARKANAREAARYQRRLHSDEDCCAGTDVSNTEETSHEEGPQGDRGACARREAGGPDRSPAGRCHARVGYRPPQGGG
jgi:uncharacterized DUF497 family protein